MFLRQILLCLACGRYLQEKTALPWMEHSVVPHRFEQEVKVKVTRIVVFGHSHVWPMRRAIAALTPTEGVPQVVAPLCGTREMPGPLVYQDGNGRLQLTATLTALLSRFSASPDAPSTVMLSMVQGNYYNQLGMVASGGFFDVVLPFAPDLPLQEGAVVLPYGAVREMMLATMSELKSYIGLMSRGPFANRTILAGPPPPVRDDAPILELLSQEGVTDAPSPPHVRLKLWHLQDRLYAEMCKGTPLVYLSGAPEGVQDDEGFLRPDFVNDAVHGNQQWASQLLAQAMTIATQCGETAHV